MALQRTSEYVLTKEARAFRLESGYVRGVIGAHLVIYNCSTNVVVDIMKDVVH